ncbi:hypothetical protein EUA50_03025 [Staphylococcus saprophyticus]|nr:MULTISPECIES: DUF6037 family protein [Staphylococcus]MDL1993673.1 DUF6037 family protein [Staphylococcus saprophyticus]MDT3968006.1 DUF6037 family protein [Staphylococcus saprophyticus]MDT3972612.1 DUF6037 family protein [Staphylococcus saprophyticus]MDT3986665.1 DUF6037 family protein [Staphylococcus saprophyticus]MDW3851619.1 DUF6037 family protein [Staphylococcus saprophyticus]
MSNLHLPNMQLIFDDMRDKDYIIDSFKFKYKDENYLVFIRRFKGEFIKRINKYAKVQLTFYKESIIKDSLIVEAHNNGLIIDDYNIIYTFFGIKSSSFGKGLFPFYESLNKAIPTEANLNSSKEKNISLAKELYKDDVNEMDKIYCIGVTRLPKGWKRSERRNEKAKRLRPALYEFFDDPSITFNFSPHDWKEKSDEQIIKDAADRL